MPLIEGKDYIFVPKVHVNEGFWTGTITYGVLVGTTNYLFIIPTYSLIAKGTGQRRGRLARTVTYNYPDGDDPVKFVTPWLQDPKMTTGQLEKKLLDILAEKFHESHRLALAQLEMFRVKKGWLMGGMFYKIHGGQRQSVNLPGREAKQKAVDFYQPYFRR